MGVDVGMGNSVDGHDGPPPETSKTHFASSAIHNDNENDNSSSSALMPAASSELHHVRPPWELDCGTDGAHRPAPIQPLPPGRLGPKDKGTA